MSHLTQVIVVGGGLSGLSAAHTVLERGGRVLLLDKNAYCGGNSTKATSGINGALTRQQQRLNIPDSVDQFLADTAKSATSGKPSEATPLAATLVLNSGSAVEWLANRFNLDLSIVNRLGGHSFPRTHRGKERFPGMTITYALMEKLEEIAKNQPDIARVITKANVFELIKDSNNSVIGVKYKDKDGNVQSEYGPVILATGGFGADFSDNGLLHKLRPDLLHLPTTNGDHCTGDGIKLAQALGADTVDLSQVQVHPTGLVHPDEPNAKVKFLAAEALRGCGGLLLNKNGERFCDELGTRDYVTGEMWKNKGEPYRLILNGAASREIEWHCKHYMGRGLMKYYASGNDLAKEMGISAQQLKTTFDAYNGYADAAKAGRIEDPFKKRFFPNAPFKVDDHFYVAWVVPVVHYCMGGVKISTDAEVITTDNKVIAGLFAAGEVTGGVHGNNRLGGSSLIDCVVFGRVSGDAAARYLLGQSIKSIQAQKRLGAVAGQFTAKLNVDPSASRVHLDINWGGDSGAGAPVAGPSAAAPAAAGGAPAAPAAAAPAASARRSNIRLAEVAKHDKAEDCWVVVNGQVLDVTKFMHEHPGGKQAILLFAGKDASAEFNMLHKPDVVEKYAADTVVGSLDPQDIKPASH